MPSERDELLDRVYARADRLWWRRRVAPVVAGIVVLALAVGVPILRYSGGTPRTRVATQPSTTVDTVPEVTTTAAPTTTTPAVTTTVRRTTTTRDPCRSPNPPYSEGSDGYLHPLPESCGPFTWDPKPYPNQPATVTVTFAPAQPRVGDTVTFHVSATDPDSSPVQMGCVGTPEVKAPDYGDGTATTDGCTVVCPTDYYRYGRWPPPPRRRGSLDQDFTHTYTANGTFTVRVSVISGRTCTMAEYDPYWDNAETTVTVTVAPA